MAVRVITPPAALVSLTLAKQHLKIEHSESDALIQARIDAASAAIDGPGGWLDRAVGTQTLEWSGAHCDFAELDRIILPYPPILTVSSVKYDDTDDAEQTYAGASYRTTILGEVELIDGYSWPTTRVGSDALRIRYTAGYATVPPPIVAAVLLMVGDMTRFAETATETTATSVPMSTTVESLLRPYKVWSI